MRTERNVAEYLQFRERGQTNAARCEGGWRGAGTGGDGTALESSSRSVESSQSVSCCLLSSNVQLLCGARVSENNYTYRSFVVVVVVVGVCSSSLCVSCLCRQWIVIVCSCRGTENQPHSSQPAHRGIYPLVVEHNVLM